MLTLNSILYTVHITIHRCTEQQVYCYNNNSNNSVVFSEIKNAKTSINQTQNKLIGGLS